MDRFATPKAFETIQEINTEFWLSQGRCLGRKIESVLLTVKKLGRVGSRFILTKGKIPMPLVEITLVEGRPAEARASMMKRITDVIEQTLGAPRQSIRVILYEVPAFHFAVGGEPKGPPPEARNQ